MNRVSRAFIIASLFTVVTSFASFVNGQEKSDTQYFELRIYKIYDFEKQQLMENYLENAFLPALERQGIKNVGVFRRQDDENDHSAYVLIPYNSLKSFVNLNSNLAKDEKYQKAAASYFDRNLKDPVYNRIESRFMKAFDGMKKLVAPKQTAENKPRIFELRLYQSHTEKHAAKKVEMFNKGEIDLMKEVGLGPVFFGETLIGNDVPNLIYMLSASDMDSHKKHWQAFLKSPKWAKMSKLEEYKDTVSKIQKWFLKPTKFSKL